MLEAMRRVGTSMREAFHWVPEDKLVYLCMDNAGGHATNEAIQEYTEELLTRFNIVLIHQVARSCETNTLNLGIWMTLQAAVERVHYLRCDDNDALFRSVQETWDTIDQTQAFSSVWGQLRNVLILIKEDGGGNSLVETKRGKTFRRLDYFLEDVAADSGPTEVVAVDDASVQDPHRGIESIQNLIDLLESDDDEDLA
jgi:hypothetical protein